MLGRWHTVDGDQIGPRTDLLDALKTLMECAEIDISK